MERALSEHISDREREIVELASHGMTDKEIAKELNIAPGTIRTYWERVRAKTHTKSRSEAIARILGAELQGTIREAVQAREDRDVLLEEAEGYAVFSMDEEGIILDWNPGVFRVLGFNEHEFVGQSFNIVFTPDDVEAREPQREMQEAKTRGRCLERRYHVRRDGAQIWVDGTLVALRDEAGMLRRYSKIMRNDSERKSLEEEVQRLRARIAASERAAG
jgi:PAS domain S-box-containing protein